MALELSYQISQPLTLVYEYLTNMQKFVTVHPIIFKIEPLENNKYLVYERLKLGFIPFSFTYVANVEGDKEKGLIIIKAIVFKVTKIEMRFQLSSKNNQTLVSETVNFKSPLPVETIMKSVFKKQHQLLFQNISQL
jgi:carbon monoxide dehydrogenase subunit G